MAAKDRIPITKESLKEAYPELDEHLDDEDISDVIKKLKEIKGAKFMKSLERYTKRELEGTLTDIALKIIKPDDPIPKTSRGLLAMKRLKRDLLDGNKSVHEEPNAEDHYVERTEEWSQVEELLSCLGSTLDQLRNVAMEKKMIFTLEYATISGAGKSRFVMHQFGQPKFKEIPMSLVGLNFNGGTGGGTDTDSIVDESLWKRGEVDQAMSRLLLSRGFFEIHPEMRILTENFKPVPASWLPNANLVLDALFEDRFPETPAGEGLLVVHLDEMWQLKKRLHYELKTNGVMKEDQRKKNVDTLVKRFISILLEYSFLNYKKGRYVLPVVSHTCPDNDLLQNRVRDATLYSPTALRLLPFSLKQSVELLKRRRERLSRELSRKRSFAGEEVVPEKWIDLDWDELEKYIALAGGHPSLLLKSFPALDQPSGVYLQLTSEASMTSNLMTNFRMKEFGESINNLARKANAEKKDFIGQFLTDCFLRKVVEVEEHQRILECGAGWFQPARNSVTGALTATEGRVSAPFPILVLLMLASVPFQEIGIALNPLASGYSPTKAMEYVSAVAVLLRLTGSIHKWKTFRGGDAFQKVQAAKDDFFSVWPIKNQAVTDFGGKFSGWKHIGQSKMGEAGASTTQGRKEVMAMAWRIGSRVRAGTLTGKVHAYWVSSRKAQPTENLKNLVHAFRVAMSGTITEKDAEETIRSSKPADVEEEGKKGKKQTALDVRDYIEYLCKQRVNDDFKFTYIGPGCVKQDDSVLPLSDLLPNGIFAAWG